MAWNPLDIAVVAIILVSALIALVRGLVHEVLSVTAWLGAAAATIFGFPLFQPMARHYIKTTLIADVVTGVTIFVVTLIVLSIISHALSRQVRESALGALDRSLGLVFGVARGAVVVCLAYLIFLWAEPNRAEWPTWIAEARSGPLLAKGAALLAKALPKDALERGAAAAGEASRKAQEAVGGKALKDLTPQFTAPSGEPAAAPKADPGYKQDDRKDMNRLLQNNQ